MASTKAELFRKKMDDDKNKTATKEETATAEVKRKQVASTKVSEANTALKKPNKRITHKVFSFWADREDIAMWQAYLKANTRIQTVEELGTLAINEYLKKHSLKNEEKQAFEAMKVLEFQKAEAERVKAVKKYS